MRRRALPVLLASVASCTPHGADSRTTSSDIERCESASRPLGATLTPTGAVFRVWAPHASGVAVTGDFDGWDSTGAPLARDCAGGTFSGEVKGPRAGQAYSFLVREGDGTFERIDPRGRQLDASLKSVLVDPQTFVWKSDFTLPPPEAIVLYELHVASFNPSAGAPGTFARAAEKLDYLAALGVNVIELMPVHASLREVDWGYSVASPFALQRSYGSPDDLKALVDAAHARGIGIVLDVVHNHYTSGNPLLCFDGNCLGKNGIYFYPDERGDTRFGPRPDYGRPEVRSFVLDNLLEYQTEYRVDGFRWDTEKFIRNLVEVDPSTGGDLDRGPNPQGQALLSQASDAVHARRPALQIAEDFDDAPYVTAPTSAGGLGFDAKWDRFHVAVNAAVTAPADAAIDVDAVATAIAGPATGRPTARVIFTESHDEVGHRSQGLVRIPARVDPDRPTSLLARKRSALGAVLALTSPGIPMLFQGQELLDPQPFAYPAGTPVAWANEAEQAGTLRLYRDLVHLRRNVGGATGGLEGDRVDVFHRNAQAKVIAFRRWRGTGNAQDVVVVVNLGGRAFPSYRVGLPAGNEWTVRLSTDWTQYGSDFGATPHAPTVTAEGEAQGGLPFSAVIELGPYTAVVLSRG